MKVPSVRKDEIGSVEPDCVVRLVAGELARNQVLEAVTIDRASKTISIATMGQRDDPALSERIQSMLLASHDTRSSSCGLLQPGKDCSQCSITLQPDEHSGLTVQQTGETVTVARVTCPTAKTLWRWKDLPLPRVVQRDVPFLEGDDHPLDEWKPQLAAAALCAVAGLTGFFLGDHSVAGLAAFIVSYVAGGWFAAEEVWERLRQRAVDVHFLMLAVAFGSACIGAWEEGATLLFLFSFSGALEHFALGRTQREIRSLFREAPKVATILDAGHEHEVPVESLRTGMRLLVKPDAQFPVDAEVVSGRTASDESNLTGEATPVEKGVGDTVLAGTMNLWGAIEAVVLRPAADSSLAKIIRLIRDAQQQKAPAQLFTDRFGTWYTYAVLALTAAMFFVWWLGFGLNPFGAHDNTNSAFYRTMTLLVVASPCALVLSIPSAVLAAIAWGARHGILFRGGAAVEKLADTRVVALDKTGTLTTGELRVASIESVPPGAEDEIARLAFSLERLSAHPLARAITRYGKQLGIQPLDLERFESVTGLGLQAWHQGQQCRLGHREWLAEIIDPARIDHLPLADPGHSEVWIAHGDRLGRVILRDDIRPQARAVVAALHEEGLRIVVLTGDRATAAEHLRNELQLDDVRASLKPEQKVQAIQELSRNGVAVAMVGDGVNDAPSLAAAHVGVAMGARGSDAALEQAEVVLMHDRLENFLTAFRLSHRARRIIRQNLVISLGTVAVLVVLAILGRIPLTLGVVGHEGSTVIVVMNSLRLLLGGVRTQQT